MAYLGEIGIAPALDGSTRVDPFDAYAVALSTPSPSALSDPFTAHVFACAIAVGAIEAHGSQEAIGAAIGLARADLSQLILNWAPGAAALVDLCLQPETLPLDEEEEQIHELLDRNRADATAETRWMTSIVTRRSMAPRHLWQDLGLRNRDELSQLMTRRFPSLSARNVSNMKWKKFFYRALCESEGFTLCAAPTCNQCGDFDNCFGD